jgi:ABC-type antimicrobial peptide transport system permease subunit
MAASSANRFTARMALELDAYLAIDDLGFIDPDVNRWLYRNRSAKPLLLFGRLQPGVSAASAQKEMTGVLEDLGREYPDTDAGVGVRIVPEPLARPLPMRAVSETIPLVQFFTLALAGLVLLLACLNVANLMLVRATAREREMAVRAALGASRLQLVRQMVVEGLLLSGLGAIAGLVVGQWVMYAYVKQLDLGADLPFAFDVAFDWRVFLYHWRRPA